MSKQPTILQIIPALGPGGAEQGCIDIGKEIVKAGAKAIIISNGGHRVHELTRAGIEHINMGVDTKNPLKILKNARKIKKIIQEHNVHIVHARSRAPAWSAKRACKGTEAKFLATCHAPYNISNFAKRFYNSIMTKGERVIAISHHVAEYLRREYRFDHSRIRVIHRGIPVDRFHPTAVTPERMIALSRQWRVPDGVNIVMMPGRLTRWKGHHVLIEAIAHLQQKDVFCVLIGSDQGRTEYRKELEQFIAERGLGGQIRIVDHCDDMPAAYMLSSVVVSASIEPEGFGRIPVEAQAMGRPIVAADHGGAQETILRGQTGWLVAPGNASAMANAIKQALSLDAQQRAILATRGMTYVAENFTKELMADKTLNVYAEILREHPDFKNQGFAFPPIENSVIENFVNPSSEAAE